VRLFCSLRSRILYAFKHFSAAEAFTLLALTVTVELASRLIVGLLSFSIARVSETVGGYTRLLSYWFQKDRRWRL
jgi:N-acetylglucosaminyl-diphospho-decaprenol L-rhamnosyltransferase